MKSYKEKFFKEYYGWKSAKEIHREKIHYLKSQAHKEFYAENHGWFKMLDTVGIFLIIFNCIALLLTGILVVKENPSKDFVEANPTQCQWNGFACHTDAWAILLPFLKQLFIWAILVALYLYQRNHTFTSTGMWILTGIIILYAVLISLDMINDLGLYLGKVIYGVKA